MILIGELRDAETAQTALQAAESGHLVFSTLHTVDAAETVGRMIEFFPPGKQQQIRSVLAGVLRGVVSQRLLPRLGGGRIAAVEVMVTNARIADLIREERTEEIPDAVAEGALLRDADLPAGPDPARPRGLVERDIAANASSNSHDFLVAVDHAMKRQTRRRPIRRLKQAAEARRGSRAARHPTGRGMRRALATAALTLALAPVLRRHRVGGHLCGPPRADRHELTTADIFEVVSTEVPTADTFKVVSPAPAILPSADVPNPEGSVLMPSNAFESRRRAAGALERGAAGALAPRRRRVRDPLAGARRDQQDRVELRPQHGSELGRCSRLDAVHARHLAALGHRRRRRRARRSVGSRGRRLRGRALSRRNRRDNGHLSRRLRLQPRPVVRGRGARTRVGLRR